VIQRDTGKTWEHRERGEEDTRRFDMCDAKRFTEHTGKSGGGTGRSGIHGNSERGDTGRFVN
jgi:hypothetical protein